MRGSIVKKLTIREARQSLSHLDRLLDQEGEITITRRGKPIGRVMAIAGKKTMPSHKDLRMKMAPVKTESQVLVREDRDGR
jgi:prevent-host-death family protein